MSSATFFPATFYNVFLEALINVISKEIGSKKHILRNKRFGPDLSNSQQIAEKSGGKNSVALLMLIKLF